KSNSWSSTPGPAPATLSSSGSRRPSPLDPTPRSSPGARDRLDDRLPTLPSSGRAIGKCTTRLRRTLCRLAGTVAMFKNTINLRRWARPFGSGQAKCRVKGSDNFRRTVMIAPWEGLWGRLSVMVWTAWRRMAEPRARRAPAVVRAVAMPAAVLTTAFASATPCLAELQFCNRTDGKIDAAFGYLDRQDGWVSKGWYILEAGECK